MSTYKTKYLKKIKKINNTLWLDKLINQLEKKIKESLVMNTFRNKHFKNELNPKYAFYDCLRKSLGLPNLKIRSVWDFRFH